VSENNVAAGVAAPTAISDKKSGNSFAIPNTNTGCEFSTRQIFRARRNIRNYKAWKGENAHAFKLVERRAVEQANAGHAVSGPELIHWLRSHDVVSDHGKACRPNNDYAPLLVRDICRLHPEVRPHVEMRTTIYDGMLDSLATGGEV
jgi:hypothetical protein